jgi:hypothetical protein
MDSITQVKAKTWSVALTRLGQLLAWTDPYHLDLINLETYKPTKSTDSLIVADFELCNESIVIRTKDNKFHKYHLLTKVLEPFDRF